MDAFPASRPGLRSLPGWRGGKARSTSTDSHLLPLLVHSTCAGQMSDSYFMDKETEAC